MRIADDITRLVGDTPLVRLQRLVQDINGLIAEIAARRQQYAHYRDRLLAFQEAA